jgi:hypothetical protein
MADLPSFSLSPDLGLYAIGNLGAASIEKGIHLRWGFTSEIGYPAYGFQLFRRPAQKRYKETCLVITPLQLVTLLEQQWLPLGDVVVRFNLAPCPASIKGTGLSTLYRQAAGARRCRRFDFELPAPVLLTRIGLQDQKGTALIIGLRHGSPVIVRESSIAGSANVSFTPALVDAVVIYTYTGGPASLCYVELEAALYEGWSKNLLPAPRASEFGFGLPLTHPDYNLHHRFENPPDPATGDFAEATARLTGSPYNLAPSDFADLRTSLANMVDSRIPGRMFDREVFQVVEGASPFFERPLDLSLLFSLHPAMGRILGLVFVDQELEPLQLYDYLLVGRWSAIQLSQPAWAYSFAAVPEGEYIPRRFALCGVFIHTPTGSRVLASPQQAGGVCRKALHVRRQSLFWTAADPLSLRFTAPVQWVLLEFGCRADPLHLSARRLGVEVGTAGIPAGDDPATLLLHIGGEPFLEVEISGGDFDLYGFRTLPSNEAPATLEDLQAPVGLGAMLFAVPFNDAPPLPPPSNLQVHGVQLPTSEQLAGTLLEADPPIHGDPQGLGLRWDPPLAADIAAWPPDLGRRPPTEAVFYPLRFQYLGDGIAPSPIDPAAWKPASDEPVAIAPPAQPGEGPEEQPLAPGEDLCDRFPSQQPPRPEEFPPGTDLWLVPWIPEGWYAAGVQSMDIFGRTSAWLDSLPALADQVPPPPPPLNVQAKLLQVDDPGLTAAERDLVAVHGDGCILLTWDWPAHLRRQAPQATNFRVYAKRRPFNRLAVEVNSPAMGATPDQLTCSAESEIPLPANSLVGCSLISRGTVPFTIAANTGGMVSDLTLQRHRTDDSLLPLEGKAAITIIDGFTVKVTSVGPGALPNQLTCVVRSAFSLVADTLAGGELTDGNQLTFRLVANAAGTDSLLTLERLSEDPTALPTLGGAVLHVADANRLYEYTYQATAWEGRAARVELTGAEHYEAILSPLDILPSGEEPVRHARIGVSTADSSLRLTDSFTQPPGPPWDPAFSGLIGREGGVSAPASIVAVFYQAQPVSPPPERERLYTSPPDFFGRAHYTLRWPNIAAGQRPFTSWNVFRASDRAVFALYHTDPVQSTIDASALSPEARTELDAAFVARKVGLISDSVLQDLSSQPGAEQAFALVNPTTLRNPDDELSLVDAVDGVNPVRYLYRLRSLDDAGNLSPFSPAMQPVYVPNTYPPAAVQVSQCRGGERQVTLEWLPNTEPDLAGYLLYSTEGGLPPQALDELRLFRRALDVEHGAIEAYDRDGNLVSPTLALTTLEADGLLVDGRVILVRSDLPGAATFYYRLAAFDTAGNPSTWTRTFTARTTGVERPSPPTWESPVTQADGLHLSWSSPIPDLNCLVQRSPDGQNWSNVTRWLGRGNYQAVDTRFVAGALTHYRLRVMLPNGQLNREYVELEVS